MAHRLALADGAIPAHREAAKFAVEVQDAVNLYAITNAFLKHVEALKKAGVVGDDLNSHPIVLAFVSKLKSLCFLDHTTQVGPYEGTGREFVALDVILGIVKGEAIQYEVIEL